MSSEPERTGSCAIHPENAREIARILVNWGRNNYQPFPWREAKEPWHGLIAEILLQRTRAINVIPVYNEFIRLFPSPKDLADAPIDEISKVIFPLGLRWRAPLLQRLGKQLGELDSKIPVKLEELLKLAGVGAYIAAAWLSFHGSRRGVIIDANVVRFICRLKDQPFDGETRRKKWLLQTAEIMTPPRAWKAYNYALLDFTMQICGNRPKCNICPIGHKHCLYPQRIQSKGLL